MSKNLTPNSSGVVSVTPCAATTQQFISGVAYKTGDLYIQAQSDLTGEIIKTEI